MGGWCEAYRTPVAPESRSPFCGLGKIPFLRVPLQSPRFPLVRLLSLCTARLHFHSLMVGTTSVLLAVISLVSNTRGRHYLDVFGSKREINARIAIVF